jgi:Na+-transporting methylmalonyl-CoA/oxaloacetate decarboxylase gamma subunit
LLRGLAYLGLAMGYGALIVACMSLAGYVMTTVPGIRGLGITIIVISLIAVAVWGMGVAMGEFIIVINERRQNKKCQTQ